MRMFRRSVTHATVLATASTTQTHGGTGYQTCAVETFVMVGFLPNQGAPDWDKIKAIVPFGA
jgi:hypothetical protein